MPNEIMHPELRGIDDLITLSKRIEDAPCLSSEEITKLSEEMGTEIAKQIRQYIKNRQ